MEPLDDAKFSGTKEVDENLLIEATDNLRKQVVQNAATTSPKGGL